MIQAIDDQGEGGAEGGGGADAPRISSFGNKLASFILLYLFITIVKLLPRT